MAETVFIAGATGAIGVPLARLLIGAGYRVVGMTRSRGKAARLTELGAEPVVADVYDAAALTEAVVAAQPEIVMHQLTDLPDAMNPALLPEYFPRNARIRIEGTRNLMDAAVKAGARRMIAQSLAFAYAPAPHPWREDDPLDPDPQRQLTVSAVAALEDRVLHTPGIEGVVLRYGYLYGPDTGAGEPRNASSVHVDAAAQAAMLAIAAPPGIYNIAEEGTSTSAKARRELGWDPGFRV
jgi:nucleoside-diphosphate-sugar epimerase